MSWHHGGSFVREPRLKYVGGVVTVKNIDCDKLGVLELLWYMRYFRYTEASGVYSRRASGCRDRARQAQGSIRARRPKPACGSA